MGPETIHSKLDTQFTLSLLSNETATQPWSLDDQRDTLGTGYVQRYRNSYYQSDHLVRVVQEVEQVGFFESIETDYGHTFLISVYVDLNGDGQSTDLVTTFGVDAMSGIMVVGELVNPELDLESAEVQERLAQYELKGITMRTEADQRQDLLSVLGIK